jgi:hypothetical protein
MELKCEICGDTNLKTKTKNNMFKMILCKRHYTQIRRHGKPLEKTIYDKNDFEIKEGYVAIFSHNKNGERLERFAKIDLEDLDKVQEYKWTDMGHYFKSQELNQYLHRFIIDYIGTEDIDHINGDKLDCRKSNLRIISHSLNGSNQKLSSKNTSGVTGVSYDSSRDKWKAEIKVNKERFNLGRFGTKDEAIIARLKAEKEKLGDVAPQKHLFENYNI